MRTVVVPLAVPAVASTAGAAYRVEELTDVTLMVHGGSGFSLLLQVLSTQDAGGADINQDWLTLGTAITTDTVTNLAVGGLPIAVTHVRVYMTTPGTPPKVLLSARSEGSG